MTLTLKMLRVGSGLTQTEFAEKIGVSQTTVSSWEQGKSVPSSSNMYKMSKIIAVDPTVIFDAVFNQKT